MRVSFTTPSQPKISITKFLPFPPLPLTAPLSPRFPKIRPNMGPVQGQTSRQLLRSRPLDARTGGREPRSRAPRKSPSQVGGGSRALRLRIGGKLRDDALRAGSGSSPTLLRAESVGRGGVCGPWWPLPGTIPGLGSGVPRRGRREGGRGREEGVRRKGKGGERRRAE